MEDPLYNEQALLLLMSNGDKGAFIQLYDYYWEPVYNLGLRITKSPESAKDLTQEIFLKVWDGREKWPGIGNFKGYLYAMARNAAINYLESTVIRESNKTFLLHYFTSQPASPHETLEQKQLGDEVRKAIEQLPPKLRQVLTLHRMEGLSHDEIAGRLDITPLSSRTYMVRALLLLRKRLTKTVLKIFL